MSLDSLARLERAHEDLIAAIDGNDILAIETKLEQLKGALAAVRGQGAWHETTELKARAERIARLGEAVRVRVNFLTDLTAQRLQLLAAARGDRSGSVYRRPRRATAAR